jgi:hypothetical protein
VLSVEDWAEIRRLHFTEGLGIKTIAKRLGVARNTVRIAVRSGQPPAYRRPRRPSAVDPYEDHIRALLKDCPTMPATVIAERIGWRRGITILKERVAGLRPLFVPQAPISARTIDPGSSRSGPVGAAGRYPGRLRTRRSLPGHRRRIWLFALHGRMHDPDQGDVRSARPAISPVSSTSAACPAKASTTTKTTVATSSAS